MFRYFNPISAAMATIATINVGTLVVSRIVNDLSQVFEEREREREREREVK